MTLREAYKQWSQQKENYQLFIKTRKIFGEVWSNTPFHLECSEYNDTDLAQYLFLSKKSYEDKVKATSVMVHVLQFGLGDSLGFSMKSVLEIYNNYLNTTQISEDNTKPKSQEQKPPIKYNDKPLIPQEIPNEPKIIEKKSKQGKPVYQLDSHYYLIKKWDNVQEASKELGIKPTSIYKAISTKTKTGGFFWSRDSILTNNDTVNVKPVVKKKVTEKTVNDNLLSTLKDIVKELRENGIDIKVIINI